MLRLRQASLLPCWLEISTASASCLT
jgi:hypothetical protein